MTTTRRELAPRYDAAAVEPAIYERWLAADAFRPADEPPPGAEPFVIIQPPPNVTGALHLGHALTAFVEDILIRYHRMRGDDTLWLPGRRPRQHRRAVRPRPDPGRGGGVARSRSAASATSSGCGGSWTRRATSSATQHRRLGASLDWSRAPLHDGRGQRARRARRLQAAVGRRPRLPRRGARELVPALPDDDQRPRERQARGDRDAVDASATTSARPDGSPDPDAWITVATTRPETIFGDTAVAVHPDDDRYRDLVGREAILPFIGRRLPIIADEHVERDFGTGAVKITPAHDFDDYEVGKRHGLPMITVLDEDGAPQRRGGGVRRPGPLRGARRGSSSGWREMGDLEGERPHEMVIGRCDRCGTVVEPRLSVQWFINVKPLAERALASVREGRTRIIPAHFEKVYAHWMENIHDWAVGRQLWWGHRIPAWYCPDGHITVSEPIDGPDALRRPAAARRRS